MKQNKMTEKHSFKKTFEAIKEEMKNSLKEMEEKIKKILE